MKIYPLFPTPVCVINNLDVDIKKLQEIVKKIDYQAYGGSGYSSKNMMMLQENDFIELRKKIELSMDTFFQNHLGLQNYKLGWKASWINLHKPNDYAANHLHPNCFYSGAFYIDVPEGDCGDFRIHYPDQLPTWSSSSFEPERKFENILNSKTWTIRPQNGTLIFFPSHIPHSVSKNRTNNNRYALAFNTITNVEDFNCWTNIINY